MENVKTGKEKQAVYTKEYKKFNVALREEFYLEALVIGYAIIEDRLISFLHHAGIVSRSHEELRINRSVYPYMRRLLGKDDNYAIKIKDISVKIKLVCILLNLDVEKANGIDEQIDKFKKQSKRRGNIVKPGYMVDLQNQIESQIDKEVIIDVLYELDTWRMQRNQLIHALMNKTVSTSATAQKQCAENGYKLTRDLDCCLVKPFKQGNSIRKKYKIQ